MIPRALASVRARATILAPILAVAVGCGDGAPSAQAPVGRESGAEQIRRVSREWESRWEDRGFGSAPSRIAMFTSNATSRIAFEARGSGVRETLHVEESFRLTDGADYVCRSTVQAPVAVRFAEHAGETAIELRRPALRLVRACDRPGFPEPTLEVDAAAARFTLRGDRLIPFSPAKERREYIPAF